MRINMDKFRGELNYRHGKVLTKPIILDILRLAKLCKKKPKKLKNNLKLTNKEVEYLERILTTGQRIGEDIETEEKVVKNTWTINAYVESLTEKVVSLHKKLKENQCH